MPQDIEIFFKQVPLDDSGSYINAAAYAFAKADPEKARAAFEMRLGKKIMAGLDASVEIILFSNLPPDIVAPALLNISKKPLTVPEKSVFAQVCLTIVKQQPDARLVAPLSQLLDPYEPARASAVEALLRIDSKEAAEALRPHLAEEADLAQKLKIAAMLGRHGIRDGYVYAIEHVSEPHVLEQAVEALAAIKEPKAVARLKEILKTSNDLRWNTAAIRALGAMQVREMAPEFLALTNDLRDPLAPAAFIALGDLGETKALPKILEGLDSRDAQIVIAAARAAGKLLALNGIKEIAIETKLVAIFCDAGVSVPARDAALSALIAIKSSGLEPALPIVVRESGLEPSAFLNRIEQEMKERKTGLWDGFGMVRR